MLTKFYLHYDNIRYELKEDDLNNWDQILCSYKRNNYDGVVRSFTSQFVFVNEAREILLSLYLKDRFEAKASISVYTATDRWEWEQKFECPLDFSTVQWEKYTFKINAVDNSLEALIKANKSTKYEFAVGSEINSSGKLKFDRIPMTEHIDYEFTQGSQDKDTADIEVVFLKGELPFIGNVGSEILINKTLDWRDDQQNDISEYLFKAVKDVTVTFDYEIAWRRDLGGGEGVKLFLEIIKNGIVESSKLVSTMIRARNLGSYLSPSDFPILAPDKNHEGEFVLISGLVWVAEYGPHGWSWQPTSKTAEEYFSDTISGSLILPLQKGVTVRLKSELYNPAADNSIIHFTKSLFRFSWQSRGETVNINVLSPRKAGRALLEKIVDGQFPTDVRISDYDPRVKHTYLIAAESLRGMDNAKYYSSFSEFCDWMNVVFGYVYYIGAPQESKYKSTKTCGQIEGSPWQYVEERYNGNVYINNIVYIPAHAKFLYYVESEGKLYSQWEGYEQYNDPETGHPRTDTLFIILELSKSDTYYFDEYSGGYLYPILYDHSEDYIGDDGQTVYFVHRSELFKSSGEIKKLSNCRDVKYAVDNSVIYSAITAGYDKKDYDSINGRDEFNFNNTYTTGCSVSDKPLSLISKYRADCYGVEFAVQKQGADTTDSSCDKDVFFVLCTYDNGELIVDRTAQISNSLTDEVFNGAFSPMACIRANAGFIGLQADEMTLKFTSSTGNSEIEIDGELLSADITLDTPLATAGYIEFTTDEVDDIANVDDLVEIVDDEDIVYRGYLKEVDVKYTKTEASKYKLIIKDIER